MCGRHFGHFAMLDNGQRTGLCRYPGRSAHPHCLAPRAVVYRNEKLNPHQYTLYEYGLMALVKLRLSGPAMIVVQPDGPSHTLHDLRSLHTVVDTPLVPRQV